MEHMDYAADNPFYLPAGRVITESDKTDTDTAIFVLTRQAGEGADRKDVPGDYYITEDEKALMLSVTQQYKNTIVAGMDKLLNNLIIRQRIHHCW